MSNIDPVVSGKLRSRVHHQSHQVSNVFCSSNHHGFILFITAFYEFQNIGACKDWVSLFASNFSVADPVGTPPLTSVSDLMDNCVSSGQAFRVVNLQIQQAFTPGFEYYLQIADQFIVTLQVLP
jgi:hypothetical protein